MRSNKEVLEEIKAKEEELNLYDFKVLNIAVWRLVRFSVRAGKLKQETGFENRSSAVKIDLKSIVFSYLSSFVSLFKIVLGRKKYSYLVLAFPRLISYNNQYLDKFTDPLIAQSNLQDNTLVLQRNISGKQFKPRFNANAEYKTSDFIDYSSKFLGLLLMPIFYIIYYNKIVLVVKNASTYFSLSKKFKFILAFKIAEFFVQCFFVKIFFNATKVKQVFLVDRIIFLPFIAVAKKMNIQVLELQHGITHSETTLYTGSYQEEIDPDLFLNFGSKWVGEQFSIPIKQQINIGWAYNSWLLNKVKVEVVSLSVLVVSAPAITDRILKTTIELAHKFKDYIFTIRLHPQEELTILQQEELKKVDNIKIDDKNIDSLVSVLTHQFVIGENSSVLYEALNLGKPVAKIMFNGLQSKRELDNQFKELDFLYTPEEFLPFVSNKQKENNNLSGIYDIFDATKFNKLLR